ncbi:MAG: response regulator [Solirubrobacteraceae bacterium]|nr:response regulator [Solirubrobacteraceae bacterium]
MTASSTGAVIGLVEDSNEDYAAFLRVVMRDAPGTELVRWERAETVLTHLEDDGEWPNILVVDLNLPGVDGCELVRRLRAAPATRALPLVILSGSGRQQDVDRCYAAGANAYLTKPSNVSELGALLKMLMSSISFFRSPTATVPLEAVDAGSEATAVDGSVDGAEADADVPDTPVVEAEATPVDDAAVTARLAAARDAYELELAAEREKARRAAERAALLQRITSKLGNAMTAAQVEGVIVHELVGGGVVRGAKVLRPEPGMDGPTATFQNEPAGSGTVGLLPLLTTSGSILANLRIEIEGELGDEQEAFLHTVASLCRAALERITRLASMVRQSAGGAPDLPARRWWTTAVAHSLEQARTEGEHLTVVVVDLDGFDRYTEAHGHVSADRLLLTVVDAFRRADIDLLSRNGGEEYAALVVGKGERQVREVIAAIRRQPAVTNAFSVGIAQWNRAEDGGTLLSRAEARIAEDRARRQVG